MDRMIEKYADKLVDTGLVAPDAPPLIGFLDAELIWNRADSRCDLLAPAFDHLNINSLLLARPAEPYRTIIDTLAADGQRTIYPEDCETRTFMHDLPVTARLTTDAVIDALRRRKSLIVTGEGVVTYGVVSPEQAYIVFSSVCFSTFVKFFSDTLSAAREDRLTDERREVFQRVVSFLPPPIPELGAPLRNGPFDDPQPVYAAICEAGRRTVELGLVDSFFGNISYRSGNTVYISQTSSSLDELDGCIDPCPLDNSSCAGVTASSELSAHTAVYERTGIRAILHGHPKFSVILSMDCEDKARCDHAGECHRRCPHVREAAGVPVVCGEVGTGRYGLCNTVPSALDAAGSVLVYGHGVFTMGDVDFNPALAELIRVENRCREEYFHRLRLLGKGGR